MVSSARTILLHQARTARCLSYRLYHYLRSRDNQAHRHLRSSYDLLPW